MQQTNGPTLYLSVVLQGQTPHLAGAFFCERAMNQGGVLSLIHVIDTFKLRLPPDAPVDVVPPLTFGICVHVRHASTLLFKEDYQLRLETRKAGSEQLSISNTMALKVPGTNSTIILGSIDLHRMPWGTSWLDIYWDSMEHPLTNVPFTLSIASMLES